jgi:hypothetical protein
MLNIAQAWSHLSCELFRCHVAVRTHNGTAHVTCDIHEQSVVAPRTQTVNMQTTYHTPDAKTVHMDKTKTNLGLGSRRQTNPLPSSSATACNPRIAQHAVNTTNLQS